MQSALAAIRVVAVIGLLAGFLWWLRRYDRRAAQPARRRPGRAVEVIGQARLSRQATVAVVRVGERSLTLGVTDHGVNLLAESEYVEPEVVALPVGHDADDEPAMLAGPGPLVALTSWWRRISARTPVEARPTFAAALEHAATAPLKSRTTAARARTEGPARPRAAKTTVAAGTRRKTAPPARKPKPPAPK